MFFTYFCFCLPINLYQPSAVSGVQHVKRKNGIAEAIPFLMKLSFILPPFMAFPYVMGYFSLSHPQLIPLSGNH